MLKHDHTLAQTIIQIYSWWKNVGLTQKITLFPRGTTFLPPDTKCIHYQKKNVNNTTMNFVFKIKMPCLSFDLERLERKLYTYLESCLEEVRHYLSSKRLTGHSFHLVHFPLITCHNDMLYLSLYCDTLTKNSL